VKVGEVSSSPLVIVSPGMPIKYAAKLMKKINLRHLAVFNVYYNKCFSRL